MPDTVVTPGGGLIAICPLPDAAALDEMRAWGAAALVSLTATDEMRRFDIGAQARAREMHWHHLPIVDFGAPSRAFEAAWDKIGPGLRRLLREGGKIALHCRGGQGRSGMIAARLLVELGIPPSEAIARVRHCRPGAIETTGQEAHVKNCRAASD